MKAHNYRRTSGYPYTRKKYMRGHPPSKITKFTMGDPSGDFEYRVSLIAQKEVQIRHNALEAVRISVNRVLERNLGKSYCLRISPYPHHILRENKMIFGAHADRLQDGMRGAFGKPIGSAARVKVDQSIINIDVNENALNVAKESLKRIKSKLPTPCRIKIKKF
jgi:large subunit ribosomal protein L10e